MKYVAGLFLLLFLQACAMQRTPAPMQTFEDIKYPFETSKLTLPDGNKIAYVDEGSGTQTILFIHGLGSYLPAWKNTIEGLRGQYRCIAIDLPGYGKSDKGNLPGSMRYYADVVKSVADQLGLKKIVIAGHSMGGQIAVTTALAYPELVDKLVLVAPAGFETFNKGQRQWFRDVMTVDGVRLTTVEQIRTNLAYNFYNLPHEAQFMIDDRIAMRSASDFTAYCYAITQGVKGMVDDPIFDLLPQVKQPALVLFGENDNLIPNRFLNGGRTADYMEKGAEKMPNATLVPVKKAGHFVMFEQSKKCNEAIQGFLR
ncbi:MAG: alpha/beta hydrolase [Saprospiraceae bacterium]|nr:alpha/beta hydrolase [Saprospiraceae bacterium]